MTPTCDLVPNYMQMLRDELPRAPQPGQLLPPWAPGAQVCAGPGRQGRHLRPPGPVPLGVAPLSLSLLIRGEGEAQPG